MIREIVNRCLIVLLLGVYVFLIGCAIYAFIDVIGGYGWIATEF